MYVPKRATLASKASRMCLREKPTRFTSSAPSFDDRVDTRGWEPSGRDAEVAFGEYHYSFAGNGVLLYGFANDCFRERPLEYTRLPSCCVIGLGACSWGLGSYCVPSVQSNFVCVLKERERLLFIEDPALPFWCAVARCTPRMILEILEAGMAETEELSDLFNWSFCRQFNFTARIPCCPLVSSLYGP